MKKPALIILVTSVVLFTGLFTSLHAGIPVLEMNDYSIDYSIYADSSTYVAQVNNDSGKPGAGGIKDLNIHKILGWTTLGTAAATFAAIGLGQKGLHCGLAYTSTVLGAATCTTGFYSYSDVIGADRTYTIHAVLGTLATAGFGAALALADGGPHAAIGSASGVAFVITIGILYF